MTQSWAFGSPDPSGPADPPGLADPADPVDPADPASMLALLVRERERAARALEPDPRVVYGVWGTAWLVGFLAWWTSQWRGPFELSFGTAGVVFTSCMVSAGVVTAVHGVRRGAGVDRRSRAGRRYGWVWGLAFGSLTAIMNGLVLHGVDVAMLGLLWSVLSGLVVGTLYAAVGALCDDRIQYWLGVWILVTSGAGGLAGFPAVYLVMAFAGGGAFLVAAAWFAVRPLAGRRPGGSV